MGACSCSSKSSPSTPDGQGELSCRSMQSATTSASPAFSDSVTSNFTYAISSIDNRGRVRDFYSVDDRSKLGVGNFSIVFKGRKRSSKQECAIKTITKSKAKNSERIAREIAVMRMLDHGNIVKLIETFEDRRTIRLVMELCTGGELSDRLIEVGKFTEGQAAGLMQQIIHAVGFMHSKHVCHRDLKPENILFASRQPIEHSTLKIIDFGSACVFQKGQPMHTKAGSTFYVAPQVLFGKYDQSSDLWSCGVIMHVLLCGYPPFKGETEEDVLIKVKKGTFSFAAKDWAKVSQDAQTLVSNLIKKNPQDRFTAEQALGDCWICNKAPKACGGALDNVTQLRRFQSGRKLRKASPQIIAERLTETQIRELEKVLEALDRSGEGMVSARQLKRGLKRIGLTELPSEVEDMLAECSEETADAGTVDYKRFVAAALDKKQVMQETACWNAFNDCDHDGDGALSHEELRTALRSSGVLAAFGDRAVESALRALPVGPHEGNGAATFDEFVGLLSSCKL